jgi:hypothetical protein
MDIAGSKNARKVSGRQLMFARVVKSGLSMVVLHGTPMAFAYPRVEALHQLSDPAQADSLRFQAKR